LEDALDADLPWVLDDLSKEEEDELGADLG